MTELHIEREWYGPESIYVPGQIATNASRIADYVGKGFRTRRIFPDGDDVSLVKYVEELEAEGKKQGVDFVLIAGIPGDHIRIMHDGNPEKEPKEVTVMIKVD